jgi:hypothetical protein
VEQESEDDVYPSEPEPEDREAVRACREVDAVLAVGARRALTDIELALARMGAGRYGPNSYGPAPGDSQDDAVPGMLMPEDAVTAIRRCAGCRARSGLPAPGDRLGESGPTQTVRDGGRAGDGRLAGSPVPEDRGTARRATDMRAAGTVRTVP